MINQDAWFGLGKFEKGKLDTYTLKKKDNGVYLFVLEGEIEVAGNALLSRDGMGI